MLKYLFILLLTPVLSWACETKNHIFLIHGIGGDRTTFGQMEKYLNNFDNCFVTTSFEYDTGNSFLSTYDFAKSFHDHVLDKVKSGTISVNDKVSLIMHSQGGIVGNIWLNMIRQTDQVLFSQVDSFITLSTPHWGADMANLGKKLFFTLPASWENPISPIGRIELNEMSYGSGTINDVSWSLPQVFAHKSLRPLSLAGYHKTGQSLIGEGDVVVPVYSSRADHYASAENVSLHDSFVPAKFTKHETTPLVVVRADHIQMDLPGIASLPKKCVTSSSCDHPSINVIINHLKGRSIASVVPKLENYRIQIFMKGLEKYSAKDISLELLDEGLSFKKAAAKINEGMAYTLEGKTSKSGAQKYLVSLKVKGNRQVVEVSAEAGYTSILNLNFAE
jgi:pimeloyl-ACP methyl ester carboxylesterase